MPDLPEYQRLPTADDDTHSSAAGADTKAGAEWSDNPPTYPPSSSTSASGSDHPPGIITFIFVPRWPIKGETESVLGVMGKNRDETTTLVKQSFPILDEYSPDRIEFLAPREPSSKVGSADQWSRITPQAWELFYTSPPDRLLVQVADLPGDAEKRSRRETRIIILVMSGIFSPLLILMLVAGIMSATEHSAKKPK